MRSILPRHSPPEQSTYIDSFRAAVAAKVTSAPPTLNTGLRRAHEHL